MLSMFIKVHTENSESFNSRKDQVLLGIFKPKLCAHQFQTQQRSTACVPAMADEHVMSLFYLISQSIIDSDSHVIVKFNM